MQKVSELTSATIGNYLSNKATWDGIIYNVKSYGAKGDGITNDYSALYNLINTTINGAKATILFPVGTYKISTILTIPSNICLWFVNGAMLSPDSGVTVTINGLVEAGLYQIFSGVGTVAGTPKVDYLYPQWWGAKADGVTDDTTAIQRAVDLANAAGGGEVHLPAGQYVIGSGVAVPDKVYITGDGPELTKILAGANSISLFTFTRAVLTDSFSGISGITLNVNAKTLVKGITTTLASQLKFNNVRFTGDFANTFLCDRGRGIYISNIITDDGPALFTDTTGTDRLFELQIREWSVMGFATSTIQLQLRRVVNATITDFMSRDLQGTSDAIALDDACEGIYIDQAVIVHPRYGITILTNATKAPFFVNIANTIIDQPSAGAIITEGDQVFIDNCSFVGGAQRNNTDHITTIRTSATRTRISNCSFWDNKNNGINVQAGATKFEIIGNKIGNQQGTAINVAVGASDNYSIISNNVNDGNTATISDSGTGTNKQIFGNVPSGTYDFMSLGGGAALKRHLTTTASLNFGPVGANTSFDIDVTITGADIGDTVAIGVDPTSILAGICYTAWVQSANTVRVRCTNATTASVDPAVGTFRVTILKY